MQRRQFLLSAAALSFTAACASKTVSDAGPIAAARPKSDPVIKPWGFDLTSLDTNVKPGDDFFRYTGNGWLAKTPIPADRTRWGTFDMLAAKSEGEVKAIIDELAGKTHKAGSVEQKIGDYYAAFLDQDAITKAGFAPVDGVFKTIAAAKTHADIAVIMARPDISVTGPLGAGISLDSKNPDRYIVWMRHGGIALPDREYYIKTDGEFPGIRTKYQAHIEKMLSLAGQANAADAAAKILALETEIAKLHWTRAERREREKTYNLRTKAELIAFAPDYPWTESLNAAGLGGANEFIVAELSAFPPLATLFKATPIDTWKAYLTYHFLRANASVLPAAIDEESFAFFGKSLNGQAEQRPRWKRSVDAVNGALGEAIGQVYVARHFSAQSKAEMLQLVENIRKAYAQRIDGLAWMSAETKVVAREKLAAFRVKIGYPDKWKDYATLPVKPGQAYANGVAASVWEYEIELKRLNQKTDRDEWFMTPQTVNAYYNPTFNEIVFPAAILQAPFFDLNADPAINYGAIGGVIGHEMGHGFDDQGAKSDARGVLRSWWNDKDVAAFKTLGDRLVAQYSAFQALPGLNLNGRVSLGENIGDNGGLQVAYEAYRMSLGGKEAAVLDGFSGDQRFFMGWAQVWWGNMREQRLRNQVMTGPHSPNEFRANGPVRNIDAWYTAFNVQPGQKLYLSKADRVQIW
jgi:putative endopeptidase